MIIVVKMVVKWVENIEEIRVEMGRKVMKCLYLN